MPSIVCFIEMILCNLWCFFVLQLLLLPDFSSESAYYAEQADGGDTSLLDLCLPRSITLGGVREECRDIVFALSVEFYGQVFGEQTLTLSDSVMR